MRSEDDRLMDELGDWLRREPRLRGLLRREHSPTPGSLGSLPELVIESCISGAAGALATTLGQSLTGWLRSRRARGTGSSGAMLTLTTQDGRSLSLDARRPVDAAEVGRFLEAALGGPVLAPDATPTTPVDGDRTT
ncbi:MULTISPECIES: hypothetical protein [unclassified Streptomyces]|uniref:effector-associated constant component EACC1 n=1 Tax=unclassified Streptomyces TaxID=2593676 RepID=UPI0027E53553|nr:MULTISPECIES: hypothetical protein [unclassified Streptomyces]